MADVVEGDHVVVLAKRHHVLRVGFQMAADTVHQNQRFRLAVTGFGNARAAIAGQIDITDLGPEKI
ncbi:hypothetical protein D3C84_851440 [compost metagenome]